MIGFRSVFFAETRPLPINVTTPLLQPSSYQSEEIAAQPTKTQVHHDAPITGYRWLSDLSHNQKNIGRIRRGR
jgi:hypothetical protein